jgi:hypothetical protein
MADESFDVMATRLSEGACPLCGVRLDVSTVRGRPVALCPCCKLRYRLSTGQGTPMIFQSGWPDAPCSHDQNYWTWRQAYPNDKVMIYTSPDFVRS